MPSSNSPRRVLSMMDVPLSRPPAAPSAGDKARYEPSASSKRSASIGSRPETPCGRSSVTQTNRHLSTRPFDAACGDPSQILLSSVACTRTCSGRGSPPQGLFRRSEAAHSCPKTSRRERRPAPNASRSARASFSVSAVSHPARMIRRPRSAPFRPDPMFPSK